MKKTKIKETPLHFVCQNINGNSLEVIKYLIEKGININEKNKNKETPLHFVCQNINGNSLEVIKYLIEKGININEKNQDKETPLHFVCQNINENSLEVIKYLIEKGININEKNKDENTPLHITCQNDSKEIVELLLGKEGINVNEKNKDENTYLHIACQNTSLEIVQLLLGKEGINVNEKNKDEKIPLECISPKDNSAKIYRLLVEKGADINEKNNDLFQSPLNSISHFNEPNILELIEFFIQKGDFPFSILNEEKPFHIICKNQTEASLKMIKYLLKIGEDINSKTNYNETSLHLACQYQTRFTIEIVKLLIEKGADINSKTLNEETPLHLVCEYQTEFSQEIVEILVTKGADIHAKTKNYGETALHLAFAKGADIHDKTKEIEETSLHLACKNDNSRSLEIIKFLIKKGAKVHETTANGETPLHLVCKYQKNENSKALEIVKFLFQKKAQINAKTKEKKKTPLHFACKFQESFLLEITYFLFKNGAKVNHKTTDDKTPLHYACQNTNRKAIRMIEILIEKGVNVNSQTQKNKQTPLHNVCFCQDLDNVSDMSKLLIEKGADINAKTEKGDTALHLVCYTNEQKKNSPHIVNYFIRKNADINAQNNEGKTPLHIACGNRRNIGLKLIETIVSAGANLEIKTLNFGDTPLLFACKWQGFNIFKIIELLTDYGANIRTQNFKNQTLLHVACENAKRKNPVELVKFLMKEGLDIHAKTIYGETPLHFACQSRNKNHLKLIPKNCLQFSCVDDEKTIEQFNEFLHEKNVKIVDGRKSNKTFFFHCEMEKGDEKEIIKYLQKEKAKILFLLKNGETPLHFACQSRNQKAYEIVQYLVKNGADVKIKTLDKETPLHFACQSRNKKSLEIIQFLHENKAKLRTETSDGNTPLHFVCMSNNPYSIRIIQFLMTRENLEESIDLDQDQPQIKPQKARVGIAAEINSCNKNKETPLHLACIFQRKSLSDVVNTLIQNGADVNLETNDCQTALHLICFHQLRYLQKLYEELKSYEKKGSDRNIDISHSSLVKSKFEKYQNRLQNIKQTIGILIEKGIELNKQDRENETALSLALNFVNIPEITHLLIMNGASIFDLPFIKISEKMINSFSKIHSINQDMYNFLKSKQFTDYGIQSNNGFKFKVHKDILLLRLDNNERLFTQFVNRCKMKSQKEVEMILNFIYTGFPNFEFYEEIEKLKDWNNQKNRKEIERKFMRISENQNKLKIQLKEFFKEIRLYLDWIQIKWGRKGIIRDLQNLYQDDLTKDFTIISEESGIEAHKLILMIRSKFFQKKCSKNPEKFFDYSRKSYRSLYQLIYFFYHDDFHHIQMNQQTIFELRDAKHKFQLNQNSNIDLLLKSFFRK
ncbi:ankyrin repeat ph and sec7 domain containing protein secg-related [Anaeramoeba ignava]|uniref:Ankyrin repeat ph and sec7 domain containing protein secg-related n=1 Tax=Anaeramoeba ignava TaxID=1746090 RepID=A0A9Q0L6X1_ANAIG|nr:ankyrin repeat ph and sec7 domain containing protein secg-related [Anaeramoeba ignava]